MPIDRTNETVLNKLKEKYGNQIEKFEYEVWKHPYLSKEPKGAFCTGMVRYRKHYRVTHVVLKDGRRISVGGVGCLIGIGIIILLPLSLLVIII